MLFSACVHDLDAVHRHLAAAGLEPGPVEPGAPGPDRELRIDNPDGSCLMVTDRCGGARTAGTVAGVPSLVLRELPGRFAVVRLDGQARQPDWAFAGAGLAAVVRRPGEVSVVCAEAAVAAGAVSEEGWAALEVEGPIGFSVTGVLAAIAEALADAGVPIFALSTYDTDVILVKADDAGRAEEALTDAGHRVERRPA